MIEKLGQGPINTAASSLRSQFMSIFRERPSTAFSNDSNRYPREYVTTRGLLISKTHLNEKIPDLTKGHIFQFNPATVDDVKNTIYEVRGYTGLSYNDYVWSGGGERVVSFQLFLDNTPQSKQRHFRPEMYGSKRALEIENSYGGYGYDSSGRITDTASNSSTLGGDIKKTLNYSASEGPQSFTYTGDAFSTTRVDERGILPEVEKIQSFMYPALMKGEEVPRFSEGGVVSQVQFRPPSVVVLTIGPLYLEGVIKSAPVQYTLFDKDLTPIRGTISIEMGIFEYEDLSRPESLKWNAIR